MSISFKTQFSAQFKITTTKRKYLYKIYTYISNLYEVHTYTYAQTHRKYIYNGRHLFAFTGDAYIYM